MQGSVRRDGKVALELRTERERQVGPAGDPPLAGYGYGNVSGLRDTAFVSESGWYREACLRPGIRGEGFFCFGREG